jgi:hypothetical protein
MSNFFEITEAIFSFQIFTLSFNIIHILISSFFLLVAENNELKNSRIKCSKQKNCVYEKVKAKCHHTKVK